MLSPGGGVESDDAVFEGSSDFACLPDGDCVCLADAMDLSDFESPDLESTGFESPFFDCACARRRFLVRRLILLHGRSVVCGA